MNDIVKNGLYVGAAIVLVQGLRKDNLLSNENVRNGTLGAILGIYGGPPLEKIITGEGISEESRKVAAGTLLGGLLGGAVTYLSQKGVGQKIAEAAGYVNNKPVADK